METNPNHNQITGRLWIPSWTGSIFFHLFVFALILFYFRLLPEPPSAPGDHLASGRIVLSTDSTEQQVYIDGDNNEFGVEQQNPAGPVATAMTIEQLLDGKLSDSDLNQNLPESIGLRSVVSQSGDRIGLSNYGELRIGSNKLSLPTGGKRGGKTLRLFATEGTGNSFVFVFDRSGSMSERAESPIRAAKAELVQAIDSLENLCRFNIIFYNEKPSLWKIGRKMIEATDQNKTAAKRFVESITPSGGTQHFEPLIEAVKHRPDVIFFLTDGDEADALNSGQLEKIRRDNDLRSQINVIQFGIGEHRESNFLRNLAAQNRGQYSYINVIALR